MLVTGVITGRDGFYRPTFTIYHPTYEFYRHPPAKEQKKDSYTNCV
ncbi:MULTISPECIES: hypothetical protein [Lysinibacillus]|nr:MULTISPECIES: hypothetical protein [Lysinibacillus]